MSLIALPAFAENYIRMLHDGRRAVVVDPGAPAPMIAALDAQQSVPAAILVTLHHAARGAHAGNAAPDALRPWENDFR